MPVLFDRTCILCGRVLPAEKRSAALCPDCAREVRTEYRYHGEFSVPGADGAAAALCYRGRVKEALHRFKFGGRPQYAAWFAAEMAAVLAAQLDRWQPTCITYLPLGFLRARERGYNQTALLARELSARIGVPLAEEALVKIRDTPRQADLSAAERRENLVGSFRVHQRKEVENKTILLVDDVLTTGATAEAIARALKGAGAKRVILLTVASVRSRREEEKE